MAIDPMLYEKISGRSADPSKRLGAALAQNEASKPKKSDGDLGSQLVVGHFKTQWLFSIIGSIVVLIIAAVVYFSTKR